VRRLFQNMPARLAMLDDTRRELAAVALLVRRLALAAPGVRFVLTVDGRMDFRSPGDGRRESALAAWYGADTAAMLVPLAEARPGGARLSGWISGPERSWTGRRHLHLYVNGRWVEPRPLLAALEQGYRPLLPRGRHPLAAVFLDLPPSLVDLNVHPAKLDVRLRWEAETAAGLAAAVRDALSSRLAAPREDDWLALPPEMTETGGIGEGAERAIAEASEPYGGWVRGPRLPQMRLLGQARGALLLAEGPQGLYLLDQHRMHERVLYDRLRAAHPHGPALDLPSPLVVDLPGGRFGGALRERLEAAGFVCRSFAGRAFVVAAAPGLPDWTPEPDALLAALHESAPDEDGWEDRLFAALACRTAVRRGAGLSDELQHRLLAGLAQSEQPGVCPHGSPAILHLSPSFLERRFRW
ncbi:MAG: DNA mismatch repair protein MutL, partial [Chloroflexi bacterium]|nr:DNA mismatch repair protein MutL [Chloroflexota bacterium]